MTKRSTVPHEALFMQIAKNITENKRQVLWVGKTTKQPAFGYTIGNQEKLLPELLLIANIPGDLFHTVLNALSDFMLQRRMAFSDGERYTLGTGHPLCIIDAKAPEVKTKYTVQAGQFYKNEDYKVQQILIPDTLGNLPNNPNCMTPFKVPVFQSGLILPGDFKRK